VGPLKPNLAKQVGAAAWTETQRVLYTEKCCDVYRIVVFCAVYSTQWGKYEVKKERKKHGKDNSEKTECDYRVVGLLFREYDTGDPQRRKR
jgi:hypothetical protein